MNGYGSSYDQPDRPHSVEYPPERKRPFTVTAALAWWDEEPADLAACVRGMAEIADRVVALDGAYRRYPGATVTSPPEQAQTIRETATEVGLDCLVLTPDRLWAGQVEKRTYLLNAACVDTDWIVVVDADHIIHAKREAVRHELRNLQADVVEAPYVTPIPNGRSIDAAAATGWHRRVAGNREWMRFLFRALPGIRVEGRHWWYSAMKNGRRVWLIHDDFGPGLPPVRLASPYEVEHRTLLRDERHILAGRAFCNDRVKVVELTGQEDDVPGLPPPEFDFAAVPYL